MSRIGKKPIVVPADVKVSEQGRVIRVEGPLGTLSREIPMGFEISTEAGVLTLKRLDESRRTRSLHGLMRTLVANMVTGVSTGFQKALEISGIGYRAEVAGDTLRMYLRSSHPWPGAGSWTSTASPRRPARPFRPGNGPELHRHSGRADRTSGT